MRLFHIFLILTIILNSCHFTSPKEYLAQASVLEDQYKLAEAIELLDKAIAKDENYTPAYINRAIDKSALKDYKGAIRDYDIVLKKDPNNNLALLYRGKNKHRMGNFNGAIEDFDRAIDNKGGENAAFAVTMRSNDLTGPSNDCSMEEIRLERAVSLYYFGKFKKALIDLQYCIDSHYEMSISLYWRGVLYITANNRDAACHDLKEALNLGNRDAIKLIQDNCN